MAKMKKKVVLMCEVFTIAKGLTAEAPPREILISLPPLSEYLTEEDIPDGFRQGGQHGASHASRARRHGGG